MHIHETLVEKDHLSSSLSGVCGSLGSCLGRSLVTFCSFWIRATPLLGCFWFLVGVDYQPHLQGGGQPPHSTPFPYLQGEGLSHSTNLARTIQVILSFSHSVLATHLDANSESYFGSARYFLLAISGMVWTPRRSS